MDSWNSIVEMEFPTVNAGQLSKQIEDHLADAIHGVVLTTTVLWSFSVCYVKMHQQLLLHAQDIVKAVAMETFVNVALVLLDCQY